MDVLPSGGIFRELQVVHDTGYFSGQASLEEDWHQVITQRRTWQIQKLIQVFQIINKSYLTHITKYYEDYTFLLKFAS